MYTIKSVFIDGLHNTSKQTYNFSNDTYIYGPNGSGKSTILNAIQFALLGYIPGTAKTKSAILSHANKNYINVELTLKDESSNTVTVYRSIAKAGAKINEVLTVTPEVDIKDITCGIETPVFDFAEFNSLSANKQKEVLSSLLPASGNVVTSVYLKKLPTYSPVVDGIIESNTVKTIKSTKDAQDCVSYFKQVLSGLNSESKRLVSTVQSLIYYDDYTGSESIEDLKSEIEDTQSLQRKAIEYEAAIKSNKHIEAQIESLTNPEGNKLAEKLEDDKDYQANLSLMLETRDYDYEHDVNALHELRAKREITDSQTAQYQKIIDSGTTCPVIGIECKSLQDNREAIISKRDKLEVTRDKLHDTYLDAEKAFKEKYEYQKKLVDRNKEFKSVYSKRDSLKSQLLDTENYSGESSDLLQDKISKLSTEYSKAIANQKYQSMMDKLQKEQVDLDNSISFVKNAIKALGENGIQSELVKKPFDDLAKEMTNTLYTDWNEKSIGKPTFIIQSKSNSFNFGFKRNDKFIPFQNLSSGEKCVFMTLFLIELTKLSKSQLKAVIIDDLFDHLDDTRFINLVSSNTHAQLIVAGVKRIESSTPFSVINLTPENQ